MENAGYFFPEHEAGNEAGKGVSYECKRKIIREEVGGAGQLFLSQMVGLRTQESLAISFDGCSSGLGDMDEYGLVSVEYQNGLPVPSG